MDNSNIKNIAGVILLYTIITSIFTFVNRLVVLIVTQVKFVNALRIFLIKNSLWIIVVIAIIIITSINVKKLDRSFNSDIFQNGIICSITGALIALEGGLDLSSSLPSYIISIQTSLKSSHQFEISSQILGTRTIIADIISIIIVLCQVIAGIYLIKKDKRKLI